MPIEIKSAREIELMTEAGRILERINEYSRDFGVQFDSEGYLTQTDF